MQVTYYLTLKNEAAARPWREEKIGNNRWSRVQDTQTGSQTRTISGDTDTNAVVREFESGLALSAGQHGQDPAVEARRELQPGQIFFGRDMLRGLGFHRDGMAGIKVCNDLLAHVSTSSKHIGTCFRSWTAT